MSVRVEWTGLEEWRQALRNLPRELTADAQDIVLDAAESAADEIRRAYPVKTGHLRDGVEVETVSRGEFGVGVVLRNRAPHAWVYEYGTQVRYTALGAYRGAMPPGHVFVPRAMRHRREMVARLMQMVTNYGLLVTEGGMPVGEAA